MEKKTLQVIDDAGKRLDVFLSLMYPEYSRGYFQKLIRDGLVRVNGDKTLPSRKLRHEDRVDVSFVSLRKNLHEEDIPLDIIFEDDDIMVINKQAGLVVHPACGHESGTLLNALSGYAKGRFSPLLVHRLDKDTSGIMVVAKTEKAKNSLVKQFQKRSIKKTYYTIVKGEIRERKGRIEAPLGRSSQDRKRIVVGPLSSKNAVTVFEIVKRNKKYSFLKVFPLTGRTHQIRSHLKYIGHPVVGDAFYGGPVKIDDKVFKRQMLHAYSISFTHPSTSRRLQFTADIPEDMKDCWNKGI
jgi:23S rRNA pseudouridine1911/1915/1917 synthase